MLNSSLPKKEIVVSFDDNKLLNYLRKIRGNYHYINAGDTNEAVLIQIDKFGHIKIETDIHDSQSNGQYLKLYIDLIGYLSTQYGSVYWWITSMASKDQFGSQAFDSLFKYYFLLQKISGLKSVIVINPPSEQIDSLRLFAVKNSYKFKILLNNPGMVIYKVKQDTFGIVNKFIFVLNIWKKIYLARKHFAKKFNKQIKATGSYYVLRTWMFERCFNSRNDYKDAYFGELPDFISKKGMKLLIIAGILNNYNGILKTIKRHMKHQIYPQELFNTYLDPLKAIINIAANKVKIKEPVFLGDYDVFSLIQKEIDKEYRGRQIYYNYMNYLQVINLVKKRNIKTFTFTYENYPWEKMCLIAFRKFSPKTNIIGYQHVPFYPAFTNYYISDYEKKVVPLPDSILTTGEVTKEYLKTFCGFSSQIVKTGCALKAQKSNIAAKSRKGMKNILVVLGEYNRAKSMVRMVYLAFKDRPGLTAIVRPHPATPVKRLINELGNDIVNCPNIRFSSEIHLTQDLDKADLVLYNASTVCFDAIKFGIPVVHVGFKDILSFDPLFMCDNFKWSASCPSELLDRIDCISQLPDDKYYDLQNAAIAHVKDYLFETTEECMEKFLI